MLAVIEVVTLRITGKCLHKCCEGQDKRHEGSLGLGQV